MALQLSMVGLIVEDMGRSLAFYRGRSLDIPAAVNDQSHVEVKMESEVTFFWDTAFARAYDPEREPPAGSYRIVPEFFCHGSGRGRRDVHEDDQPRVPGPSRLSRRRSARTWPWLTTRTGTPSSSRRVDGGDAMNDDERRAAEIGLREIPHVGPATARDLIALGILSRADAAGKDPDALYETLCARDGVRHDPCVRDVFAAVVAYADGEAAQPCWVYSCRRKERERGGAHAGQRRAGGRDETQ